MKLSVPAVMAVLFLSACGDLTDEQREVLMAEAVFLADALTDGDLSADDLSDNQRQIMASACRLGPVFAPDEFVFVEPVCALLEEE